MNNIYSMDNRTGMLWMGDSYTQGIGLTDMLSGGFNQAMSIIAVFYPGATGINEGISGVSAQSYAGSVTATISATYNVGPVKRFNLQLGYGDLLQQYYQVPYTPGAASQYLADMNQIANCWYFYFPGTQSTINTLEDLTSSAGYTLSNQFEPSTWPTFESWLTEMNADIVIVANNHPGMKIVDLHGLFFGHPEYYSVINILHPSDAGDIAWGKSIAAAYR